MAEWIDTVKNSNLIGQGIVVLAVLLLTVFVVAYLLLFLTDVAIITELSGGRHLVIERTGISIEPAPDYYDFADDDYDTNGLDHIEPYIERLLSSSGQHTWLGMYTLDGNRGFSLPKRNDRLEAGFMVDWRTEPERETAIRTYFRDLEIEPTEDYLAGNGLTRDATRCLSYPIAGDAAEVTELTKEILQQLCGISPEEGLQIKYKDY